MDASGATAIDGYRPRVPATFGPDLGRFAAPAPPEPCSAAELRALLFAGDDEADLHERGLAFLARAQGAIELAVGEGLAALCIGERLISLGYSCLGDYAREVLGLRERTAQNLAHLARELSWRPLLRAAVRAGEVSTRKAQAVLPVASGEAEAGWVERARGETVRALEEAVRRERGGGDEEEEWVRVRVGLTAEDREAVDEGLAVAGKVLPGSDRWQRLEAMAQEYLGEHPEETGDDGAGAGRSFREIRSLDEAKARLEAETERWSYLPAALAFQVPEPVEEPQTAAALDRWLRELAELRASWDGLLGYCAWSVKRSGLWRMLGFASFGHYCEERLGMAARTVEQRAALERRLWANPALRAARDQGLSYEKLRALAHLSVREVERWLPRARVLTCIALRRELDAREETQMRAARVFTSRMPSRAALVLAAAFRAVRAVEGCLLPEGKCLVRVAQHFAETWKPHLRRSRTTSEKVRERDLLHCQVPGCSRRAAHAHHVVPRSHGGGDEPGNLVALCASHHLRGVHGGHLRVRGQAPDGLRWEAGGRAFEPAARPEAVDGRADAA
jgi:hypothetical protein